MPWVQVYTPFSRLGLCALVAALPLFVLFYMLGIRRAKGHHAAALAAFCAMMLAVAVWGMPVTTAVAAAFYGAAFGLFPIVWIIVSAIWLYNLTVESGDFKIIKSSLAAITDDRRLQALLIAFAFGSFLEGTAGFGTPVAISAAMLVGLGFDRRYAAGLCLIANTAPVAFGALGVPIVVAAGVSGLEVQRISAIVGFQIFFLSLIVPLWLAVTMSGWRRSLEIWPAIVVAGVCFSVPQYLVARFVGPFLPDIVSAVATIAGLGILLRFWKPKAVFHFAGEAQTGPTTCLSGTKEIVRAWTPYGILALTVLVWGQRSVKTLLSPIGTTLPWPFLHNLVHKTAPIVASDTPYPAVYVVDFACAAGTAIFCAGILSVAILPNYGFRKAGACLVRTIHMMRLPILTICLILGLAFVMNYSGMSSTLGLAFTSAGGAFPFFAPLLGWIGVFLTGSDTSSNALFASLQKTTAQQIGVDPYLMVAASSTGGVTGKMISPQSIAVAAAATGLVGEEGAVFRWTFFHSVAMAMLVAFMTLLQAYGPRLVAQ